MTTPNGTPNGRTVVRPDDGHDPAFFITQGQAAESLAALFIGGTANLGQLPEFFQGASWDEQRVGGTPNPAYVDYSTIAIGLFGAAAGIPESILLELQNVYAARNSTFAPNTLYDSTYTYLPERNVQNTTLGYNLYQSNAFGVCK